MGRNGKKRLNSNYVFFLPVPPAVFGPLTLPLPPNPFCTFLQKKRHDVKHMRPGRYLSFALRTTPIPPPYGFFYPYFFSIPRTIFFFSEMAGRRNAVRSSLATLRPIVYVGPALFFFLPLGFFYRILVGQQRRTQTHFLEMTPHPFFPVLVELGMSLALSAAVSWSSRPPSLFRSWKDEFFSWIVRGTASLKRPTFDGERAIPPRQPDACACSVKTFSSYTLFVYFFHTSR